MTGICGWVFGRGGGAGQMDPMLAAMADYGAESTAWSGAGWSLGLRHGAAAQLPPKQASWRTGGLAVVAAVRLDNRDELGDALGLQFAAGSALADQDLILAAYRRWGRECPDRLLGDYAFAISGQRAGPFVLRPGPHRRAAVLLRRNIAGLCLRQRRGGRSGRAGGSWRTRRDHRAHLSAGGTCIRPPALSFGRCASCRRATAWWSRAVSCGCGRCGGRPEELPRLPPTSDDDYAAQFLRLYRQAVRDRLHGPDPMGTHLSGGLDSSSISVLAAGNCGAKGARRRSPSVGCPPWAKRR